MSTEQPPRRPTVPVPNLGDVRPSQDHVSQNQGGPRPPSGGDRGVGQGGGSARPQLPPDPNWMVDRVPPTLHPLGPLPGRSETGRSASAPQQQAVQTRNPEYPPDRRTSRPDTQHNTQAPSEAPSQAPRPAYRQQPGQDQRPTYRPDYRQEQSPETDYGVPPPLRSLRQPEPEPQISRGGRIVLWSVLGLVGLLAVSITGLLIATPVDLVRDQLAQKIKVRTGRDLVVTGKTTLSFFPSIALGMNDVSLSAQRSR
jgi:hypothetical protein